MVNGMNTLENKKMVCLGGGIGTVNLIRGLKKYTENISVIVSMADEGGSAGRLRRLYNILPPGDIVSCMAGLINGDNPLVSKLLTYRFPGDRYGDDKELAGHKLGNLMMAAAYDMTGNYEEAIALMKQIFKVQGNIYPATLDAVSLNAITVEGKEISGEEAIDLGKYNGKRVLEKVFISPDNPKVNPKAVSAIKEADVIIAGPGDLYSTILPVLIIKEISQALIASQKPKVFIVNVANKPFETKGYTVIDFINAITKHLGTFPFDKVIINNDYSYKIPSKYHYSYVEHDPTSLVPVENPPLIIAADLVNQEFPLYHDSEKLAYTVYKNI